MFAALFKIPYNETGLLCLVLAALVADCAARLARALAGRLALAAAAGLNRFLKISRSKCFDVLHDLSSF